MSKYILTVQDKEVSNWSAVGGLGSHVATHEVGLSIEIDTVGNKLTIDTVSEAISDLLDVTLLGSDINYCNGIFGTFDIIENSRGVETVGGDYISFYWFKLAPKPEYINLEQLFGGSN